LPGRFQNHIYILKNKDKYLKLVFLWTKILVKKKYLYIF